MKLTKQNAQLQLFKVNRNIEKKVAEHTNELGKYNKGIVMDELQLLWDRKDVIERYIKYHRKLKNI